MIFGAREDWLSLSKEIEALGKQIEYYVVSTKENNPNSFNGKPVRVISEMNEYEKSGVIIISNALDRQEEIYELLKIYGFKYIFYGIQEYSQVSEEEKEYFSHCGWKIQMTNHMNYGQMRKRKINRDDIMIYMVTSHLNEHQTKYNIKSDILNYIQAGCALTDKRICDFRDDIGDNISQKNQYYCELTAGYWILKNDLSHQYVGLYHYSRMFDLTELEVIQLLECGIDVILSEPLIFFTSRKNEKWCSDSDLKEAVKETYPEYLATYEQYEKDGLFIPSNMFVGKKRIYDQYYEWMITIFERYEHILNKKNRKIRERSIGYMAEELTGIFFLHHSGDWNVAYAKQKKLY